MGASSSHDWQPPPQPMAEISSGAPVDYHLVASEITLTQTTECDCCDQKVNVVVHPNDLYTMLAEQFPKGYRMLYFGRRPGDLRLKMSTSIKTFFHGFFRRNPNLWEREEGPVSRSLRVERSWVQSTVENTGGFLSLQQRRTVNTSQLVESIMRNTQNGERLLAACETGHSEGQGFTARVGPHLALDLFFEVPSPPPRERYVYNIALLPVHIEYPFRGNIFFPEIQCNWMGHFQEHLRQGWRLIDIYIDTPMIEQFRVPMKQRANFCRPADTNGLWIFERPASMAEKPWQRYEGSIMEQTVPIQTTSFGVKSNPDWLPLIQDMGMRGWELACVVESHKVDGGGLGAMVSHIKSLLFFQRPVTGGVDYGGV